MGAAGLPEARGDPGVFSSPETSLHRPVGKASQLRVERAQAVLEEAGCFPQPSRSAHHPHAHQLCDEKEIGSNVRGGPVPVLAGKSVGHPFLACLHSP